MEAVLGDMIAIAQTWLQDGISPYEASGAWGYFWGVGMRTAPGLGSILRLAAGALLGLLLGFVRYVGTEEPEVKREVGQTGGV